MTHLTCPTHRIPHTGSGPHSHGIDNPIRGIALADVANVKGKPMILASRLSPARLYVALMMQIVGRGLVAASRCDGVMRKELVALPPGYRIAMTVDPDGPGFMVEAADDGRLRLASGRMGATGAAHLTIRFKHIAHAFLVMSFQEGTAQAFANDRMVADGDVAIATRLVRCLNRMESIILPAFIARRAVKRYTPTPLLHKLGLALRIYAGAALTLLGFH